MVKLSDGQSFLKTADVNNGDVVKFLDEGAWTLSQKYTYPDGNPQKQFQMSVEVNGEKKTMNINKTNRTNLSEAWGSDTANWVGKTASIEKVKALVSGKMLDVIVLTAVKGDEKIPF